MVKSIFNGKYKMVRRKNSVDQVFEFGAVNIKQFVSGNNFHVCHEKGWLQSRARNSLIDIKVGDSIECYTVEEVARTLAGASQ